MVSLPSNLAFKIVKFDDWNSDVLSVESPLPCYVLPNLEGRYKAVVIQFELEKSCYATMLMRELFRCSSEAQQQDLVTRIIRDRFGTQPLTEANDTAQNLPDEQLKEADSTPDQTS